MSDTPDRASDWSASLGAVYREYEEGGEIRVRPVRDEIDACLMWYRDDRSVGRYESEHVEVLTSFVGLRWGTGSPPLVYETLARDGLVERKWRYASRKEAKEGHDRLVQMLEGGVLLGEVT